MGQSSGGGEVVLKLNPKSGGWSQSRWILMIRLEAVRPTASRFSLSLCCLLTDLFYLPKKGMKQISGALMWSSTLFSKPGELTRSHKVAVHYHQCSLGTKPVFVLVATQKICHHFITLLSLKADLPLHIDHFSTGTTQLTINTGKSIPVLFPGDHWCINWVAVFLFFQVPSYCNEVEVGVVSNFEN